MPGPAADQDLVVAAMPAEMAPLVELLQGKRARPPAPHTGLWISAGSSAHILVTGDGAARAQSGISAYLQHQTPKRILVVGVSGALSPELTTGDLVQCTRLFTPNGEVEEGPHRAWAAQGATHAAFLTSPRIVTTAAQKAGLRRDLPDGPCAVDLETAVYARAANEQSIPWAALRAISDSAHKDLPVDFQRFRRGDGPVSQLRVALHLLVRPKALRACMGLQRAVAQCARSLAPVAQQMLA